MTKEEQGIQVPYSSGRSYPRYEIPENACDCHHHIYDPVRFPYVPTDTRNQPPSTVDCYRLLQKRLRIKRNVIVQPSAYGTDNRCTLDALKQMGRENTRAVVVIDGSATDEDLRSMDAMGVCGVRMNLNRGGSDDFGMIERLAERIAPFGWAMYFWMKPELIVQKEDYLRNLPCHVVFDHRGNLPAEEGIRNPAFRVISRMIEEEKAWVKLTALYIDSAREDFADTIAIGREYVKVNPDRCLWGTDWPHPNCYSGRMPVPDDVYMLEALMTETESPEIFRKILVDNPEKLYGFGK